MTTEEQIRDALYQGVNPTLMVNPDMVVKQCMAILESKLESSGSMYCQLIIKLDAANHRINELEEGLHKTHKHLQKNGSK